MYQLYWSKDSGALAPQIVLEEIGAKYERIILDLDKGDEENPKFLAVNPRGQVPALIKLDGTIITESAAICLHLSDCHPEIGLMPAAVSSSRARAYRWLFFAASNLYEGVLRLYYSDKFTTNADHAESVEKSAREFVDYSWSIIESELGNGPYLLGQEYSLVDPYLLMLTNWHENPDELFDKNPKLLNLCEAVRSRPAVEKIWPQNFPSE
jgi:glutathione S-transferase